MLQLIKDTPREIIDMLKAIDYTKFSKEEENKLLDELETVIEKFRRYIPIRPPDNYSYSNIHIPNCPNRLIKIANRNWWAKIGKFHKMIALPVIKIWMQDNLM